MTAAQRKRLEQLAAEMTDDLSPLMVVGKKDAEAIRAALDAIDRHQLLRDWVKALLCKTKTVADFQAATDALIGKK